MTVDAIPFAALIGLGSLFLAGATFYAGWVTRVGKGESAAADVKGVKTDLDRVERDLSDFKQHVASTYASNKTLEQMERRLVDAINRLGDRLDRVFHPPA